MEAKRLPEEHGDPTDASFELNGCIRWWLGFMGIACVYMVAGMILLVVRHQRPNFIEFSVTCGAGDTIIGTMERPTYLREISACVPSESSSTGSRSDSMCDVFWRIEATDGPREVSSFVVGEPIDGFREVINFDDSRIVEHEIIYVEVVSTGSYGTSDTYHCR